MDAPWRNHRVVHRFCPQFARTCAPVCATPNTEKRNGRVEMLFYLEKPTIDITGTFNAAELMFSLVDRLHLAKCLDLIKCNVSLQRVKYL